MVKKTDANVLCATIILVKPGRRPRCDDSNGKCVSDVLDKVTWEKKHRNGDIEERMYKMADLKYDVLDGTIELKDGKVLSQRYLRGCVQTG